MPTSRLQGWDWIESLMDECPDCGEKPTLGTPVFGKKWCVCCMVNGCPNFTVFQDDNPYMAIHKWNMWCRGMKKINTTKMKPSRGLRALMGVYDDAMSDYERCYIEEQIKLLVEDKL